MCQSALCLSGVLIMLIELALVIAIRGQKIRIVIGIALIVKGLRGNPLIHVIHFCMRIGRRRSE